MHTTPGRVVGSFLPPIGAATALTLALVTPLALSDCGDAQHGDAATQLPSSAAPHGRGDSGLSGGASEGAATPGAGAASDAGSAGSGSSSSGVGVHVEDAGAAAPASAAEGGASAPGAPFVVPIDSVQHKRTWMAFPDSAAIWGSSLSAVQKGIANIAKTIAKYEPVFLLANPSAESVAKGLVGTGVTVVASIPIDDCWIRDSGPVFRTDGHGGRDAIGLNFNGWGQKQAHANDSLVAERIAQLAGVPFQKSAFVGEGGAIETDGNGTLMATKSSLLNANRNPQLSQSQVESVILAAFGATKMVWFDGIVGQDITDDHVDSTSRFVAPALALVQFPQATDTTVWDNDERAQFNTLAGATSAKGQSIRVTKLGAPSFSAIRQQADTFVDAYANYYVCNGAVISAQFGDAQADASAKAALAAAYPGRIIEQINIDQIGLGGGGIHCVTQQEPAE